MPSQKVFKFRSEVWKESHLGVDHTGKSVPGRNRQIPLIHRARVPPTKESTEGPGERYRTGRFRFQEGGGGKGTRTPDPLLAKQMLSQLSYAPTIESDDSTRDALRRAGPFTSSFRDCRKRCRLN